MPAVEAPATVTEAAAASVAVALRPSSDFEELKPVRAACPDCGRPATRTDGKCSKHSGLRLTTKARQEAAAEAMRRDAQWYRKQHRQATERAAAKGDAEPAQWALLHTGVVKPVAEKSAPSVGVIVNVGTVLPGLREEKP